MYWQRVFMVFFCSEYVFCSIPKLLLGFDQLHSSHSSVLTNQYFQPELRHIGNTCKIQIRVVTLPRPADNPASAGWGPDMNNIRHNSENLELWSVLMHGVTGLNNVGRCWNWQLRLCLCLFGSVEFAWGKSQTCEEFQAGVPRLRGLAKSHDQR